MEGQKMNRVSGSSMRDGNGKKPQGSRVFQCENTDLLELLDGTLVDTTALVDQVTGLER